MKNNCLSYTDIIKHLACIPLARFKRDFNLPIAPKVISYSVTWRCDAKCIMCDNKQKSNSSKVKSNELTADNIYQIFSDKMLQSLDLIRFTGGEPMIKDDIVDIIKAIYDQNNNDTIYYLTTNGSQTDKIVELAESLISHGVKLHLQISLDAPGDLHDKIRCYPGLYSKVIKTLEKLSQSKVKDKCVIGISQTIIPENFNTIEKVKALANKLGFSYKHIIAFDLHENNDQVLDMENYKFNYRGNFTNDQLEMLYGLNQSKKTGDYKKSPKSAYLWNMTERFLYEGGSNRVLRNISKPGFSCMALFSYFKLLPFGEIIPCTLKSNIIGNIKEKTFSEIWLGNNSQEMRHEVRKCKGCWVECDVVPSVFYSGDLPLWFFKKTMRNFSKNLFSI